MFFIHSSIIESLVYTCIQIYGYIFIRKWFMLFYLILRMATNRYVWNIDFPADLEVWDVSIHDNGWWIVIMHLTTWICPDLRYIGRKYDVHTNLPGCLWFLGELYGFRAAVKHLGPAFSSRHGSLNQHSNGIIINPLHALSRTKTTSDGVRI